MKDREKWTWETVKEAETSLGIAEAKLLIITTQETR